MKALQNNSGLYLILVYSPLTVDCMIKRDEKIESGTPKFIFIFFNNGIDSFSIPIFRGIYKRKIAEASHH